MKYKNIGITVLINAVLLLLIYSFSSNNGKIENVVKYENSSISGEALFLKNCAACHGIDRKGNPPVFPSLVSVNQRLERDSIGRLLLIGRNVMPSFTHLSESERVAIIGFLFGENTESEIIKEFSLEESGRNLFVANCSRCHKMQTEEQEPIGQKSCGMQPAVLGGISSKYELDEFEYIVNSGPCYMPSFEHLKREDKAAIYAYLKSFEDEKSGITVFSEKKGCRMGCGR